MRKKYHKDKNERECGGDNAFMCLISASVKEKTFPISNISFVPSYFFR